MSEPNVTFQDSVLDFPSFPRRSWWWKIAFPIGLLLAFVAVGIVYLFFEPKYEASALLEISEHVPYIAYEPKEDKSVFKTYFRSQMEIIRSRWIIERTVLALESGRTFDHKTFEFGKKNTQQPSEYESPLNTTAQSSGKTATSYGDSVAGSTTGCDKTTTQLCSINVDIQNREDFTLNPVVANEKQQVENRKPDVDNRKVASRPIENAGIPNPWNPKISVAGTEKNTRLPEIFKNPDPIDWLRKQITVATAGDSDVFVIRYSSADPNNAALVVNTVTEQYLKALEEEEAARNALIVNALAMEMRNRESAVKDLRKQLLAKTQEVEGMEPDAVRPDPSSPNKNPLAEFQSKLIDVQIQRAMLSAQISANEEEFAVLEKASASKKTAEGDTSNNAAAVSLTKEEIDLRDAMIRRAVEDNAEVKQWYSLLVPKQMQLLQIETSTELGKQHPSYIKLQKEIAKAEQTLNELKQKLTVPIQKEAEFTLRAKLGDSGDNEVTTLAKRREELARMRNTLRVLGIAESNLQAEYKKKMTDRMSQLRQVSQENVNLTFLKDELAEKEGVLKRIAQRQIALQTESSAPTRVIWHEPAKPPDAPGELPYGYMALAGLGGLCLPYAAGLIALILWNLGKLIRKLEPVETDVATPPSSPS